MNKMLSTLDGAGGKHIHQAHEQDRARMAPAPRPRSGGMSMTPLDSVDDSPEWQKWLWGIGALVVVVLKILK